MSAGVANKRQSFIAKLFGTKTKKQEKDVNGEEEVVAEPTSDATTTTTTEEVTEQQQTEGTQKRYAYIKIPIY